MRRENAQGWLFEIVDQRFSFPGRDAISALTRLFDALWRRSFAA
jgi:hypothetical protein